MSIEKMKRSLQKLANELNKRNISWSLGASMMLYFYGLDVSPSDIDIIVDEKDHEKLLEVLINYPYTYQEPHSNYCTKHFYSVTIDEVDFDIMIQFCIDANQHRYIYPFHIDDTILLNNTTIYLASVKEWEKAYEMMNRHQKVMQIRDYLKKKNL